MSSFDNTRWSVVLRAGQTTPQAQAALAELCRIYRAPVLAYIRHRGYDADAAEDLAQAFFVRFIESGWHALADPSRGRFRNFLLTTLKRHLINSDQETHRLKRGGKVRAESLSEVRDDELATADSPETAFQHAWAVTVLGRALARLRAEAAQLGKAQLFEHLSPFLVERPGDADYAHVAETLNMRRNTLAVAIHRLRHRLREIVREEISDTTVDDDGLDEELNTLREALKHPPR